MGRGVPAVQRGPDAVHRAAAERDQRDGILLHGRRGRRVDTAGVCLAVHGLCRDAAVPCLKALPRRGILHGHSRCVCVPCTGRTVIPLRHVVPPLALATVC